ncbi:Uncharacterized protein Fot_50437 [Forsythia ovata]
MMVAVQMALTGVNILYKLAANDGMSLKVLVAYRFMFAALTVVPLALILERNGRARNPSDTGGLQLGHETVACEKSQRKQATVAGVWMLLSAPGFKWQPVLVVKGAVRWRKRSCVEIAAESVRERMRNFGRMDEGFKFCLCINSDVELSTMEREEVGRQKRKKGRRTGKGESGSPESEGRRKWRKGDFWAPRNKERESEG